MNKSRRDLLNRACWSLALAALGATAAKADDFIWTNGASDGGWANSNNWTGSTDGFPQQFDNAFFSGGTSGYVFLNGDRTVNELVFGDLPMTISANSGLPSSHTLSTNSIGYNGAQGAGEIVDSSVTVNMTSPNALIDMGGGITMFGALQASGGIHVVGQNTNGFMNQLLLVNSANNIGSYQIENATVSLFAPASLGSGSIEMGIGSSASSLFVTGSNLINSGNDVTVDSNGTANLQVSSFSGLATANLGALNLNDGATANFSMQTQYNFSSVMLSGSTSNQNANISTQLGTTVSLSDITDNSNHQSLTFTGHGTVLLQGNGSFSGGISIIGGLISNESLSSWGSGPIAVHGGGALRQNFPIASGVPSISVDALGALGGTMVGFVYSGPGQNVALADDAILFPDLGRSVPVRGVDVTSAAYWLGVTNSAGTYTVGDNGSSIFKGAAFGIFSSQTANGPLFTGTINEAVSGRGILLHSVGHLFFGTSPADTPTFNTTNTDTGVTINVDDQPGQPASSLNIAGHLNGAATVYTLNLNAPDIVASLASQTIHEQEIWNVNGGTLTLIADSVRNGGLVNVNSGATLLFQYASPVTGSFDIKPGGAFEVNSQSASPGDGGSFNFEPGSIVKLDGFNTQFDVGGWLSPNSDVQLIGPYSPGGPGLLLGAGRHLTSFGTNVITAGNGIGLVAGAPADARLILSSAKDYGIFYVRDSVSLSSRQTLQVGDSAPFQYDSQQLLPQSGVVILSASSNVGHVDVTAGATLVLTGTSQSLTTSSITVEQDSTLQIDNTGAYVYPDVGNSTATEGRISDAASLSLKGGTFTYRGSGGINDTETLGAFVASPGASAIHLMNQSTGPTTINFGEGLDASNRNFGTIRFEGHDTGGASLGGNEKVFLAGQPDGFIGAWAVADIDPGDGYEWDANFAKYDFSNGVIAMDPNADYASDFSSTDHVRLTGPTALALTGATSVATLTLDGRAGGVSVDQAGFPLRITKGGILSIGLYTGVISGGTLTTGTSNGELDIYNNRVSSLNINSQIVNNGSTPLTLVKSGQGSLVLGGNTPNTFTGTTYVNEGILYLSKMGTYAMDGPVVVRGGQLIQLQDNQFGPDVNLTVNSGSLSLQANTIQSYTINNGAVSSADAWNVTSATLNGGATTLSNGGVWTIGEDVSPGLIHPLATQTVLVVNGGVTHIVAGSSTIVKGATTFSGTNNPTIQIDAGSSPVAGLLTLQGDVNVIGTSGVAAITCPTVAAGQTAGTVDLNGAMRTFSIISGGTLVVSARVSNGGVTMSGSGTMELMAANNYAGGTVLAGGTLVAGDPAALGNAAAAVTFSGGSLALRTDSSAATLPQSLTTANDGSTNIDLGPITTFKTGTAAFTTGTAKLGVALNVTGSSGASLTIPGVSLQNTSGNPTAIHNSADVTINGAVAMAGGATNGNLLKDQAGVLTFAGTAPNTYTGSTTISGGTLVLAKSANVIAVPGNLTIFSGGTVQLSAAGQIAGSATVTLNVVQSPAVLDLNGNNNEFNQGINFIAGGTLQTGAGTATLGGDVQFTGTRGTAVISGNLNIGATTRTFNVARGSAPTDLQITAAIAGGQANGTALIKSGLGVLELSGNVNYSGATSVTGGTLTVDSTATLASSSFSVAGGALNLNGNIPSSATITVGPGSSFAIGSTNSLAPNVAGSPTYSTRTLGALNISNGSAVVSTTSTNAHTLLITTPAIAGPHGILDLENNDLIAVGATATNVFRQLQFGFNARNGYWNGAAGIISSASASDTRFLTTLGYRAGTFDVDGTRAGKDDVTVKYTYYGDADLDGTVTGADYQQIDQGFGNGATGWTNGDFNYDGVINGSDFALIDNVFNQINATDAGAMTIMAAPAGLIAPETTRAVPEPAMAGLLCAGAMALGYRRRRVSTK